MKSNSTGSLFGTDGIRGIANDDLTSELALDIGRAFGGWLAEQTDSPHVLMARDTRVSGPMLATAVAAGLCSAGIDVRDCGILTTPGLCLLVREQAEAGGVVISASHNPPEFNGIKLINSHGEKLSEQAESAVERGLFANEDAEPPPGGTDIGIITDYPDAGEQYLELLRASLGETVSLGGISIMVDCAFGAAFQLGPEALRRAGAEVSTLNAAPDGSRINDDCGSANPQPLAEQVVAEGADLGVAFDGDADRAVFVDHTGTVRDGDFVKFIVASDLHSRGLLDPPLVVGTVMSNLGLEMALESARIELVRASVGDRDVLEQMKAHSAMLGGEQSGHIIFAEVGVGDGIYTALRVAEVVARTGRTLADLCAPLTKVPQILLNVPVRDKHAYQQNDQLKQEVKAWQAKLADTGRLLVRPSGTESVVRVMVEARDKDLAKEAAQSIAELIAAQYGDSGPSSPQR